MSFDPVQILNNLRKKSHAQVSVQPSTSNSNLANHFTTQSSFRKDNSNFDSFHPSQDIITGLGFQTEEYETNRSHRSQGSEFTINPTEMSSTRARHLTGFDNTGFFRTEPDSNPKSIPKKLEFTPRVGPDVPDLFSYPSSSPQQENLILIEYAKKFQEVEKKLQEQEEKLAVAYNQINQLRDEKAELEQKFKVRNYEESVLDPSHSVCLFDGTRARGNESCNTVTSYPSKNHSISVESILTKKERSFSPAGSKNASMKSLKRPGAFRLEPFIYLNRHYPDLPKSLVKINLSELSVHN